MLEREDINLLSEYFDESNDYIGLIYGSLVVLEEISTKDSDKWVIMIDDDLKLLLYLFWSFKIS